MLSKDANASEKAIMQQMTKDGGTYFGEYVFINQYSFIYKKNVDKFFLINLETRTIFNIWWHYSNFLDDSAKTTVDIGRDEKKNIILLDSFTPKFLLENWS